jgi:hypothetical protein
MTPRSPLLCRPKIEAAEPCLAGAGRGRGTLRQAMADDEFAKITKAGLSHLVTTGSVALLTPVVGPVLAIVFTACLKTATDRILALSKGNDEKIDGVRLSALEDDCVAFRDELRDLREELRCQETDLDAVDTMTAEHVFTGFFEARTEARSPEKRRAIARVAARQFDPRLGPQYVRAYWFERVRTASDLELMVIAMMARYPVGTTVRFGFPRVEVRRPSASEPEFIDGLSDSEIAAYSFAAGRAKGDLLMSGSNGLTLHPAGFELARFLVENDVERPRPAHTEV